MSVDPLVRPLSAKYTEVRIRNRMPKGILERDSLFSLDLKNGSRSRDILIK